MLVVGSAMVAICTGFIVLYPAQREAEEVGFAASRNFHVSLVMGPGGQDLQVRLPALTSMLVELSYFAFVLLVYVRRLRRDKLTNNCKSSLRPIVLMLTSTIFFVSVLILLMIDIPGIKLMIVTPAMLVDATCLFLMLIGDNPCYTCCCGSACDSCCAKVVYGESNYASSATDEERELVATYIQ